MPTGVSGYFTSISAIQSAITQMRARGFTWIRISGTPPYLSQGNHAIKFDVIDYLLDNTDFIIVIDPIHLYPPTEASASQMRANLQSVKNRLVEIALRYQDNPRVYIELMNEYVSPDFNTVAQDLLNTVRAVCTNYIVVDKWETNWYKLQDPLGKTIQGMHFYFNSWSVSGCITQMQQAISKGIKLIMNTEDGADSSEGSAFSQGEVDEVSQFLAQCKTLEVNGVKIWNALWQNENMANIPYYDKFNLVVPQEGPITITGTSRIIINGGQ